MLGSLFNKVVGLPLFIEQLRWLLLFFEILLLTMTYLFSVPTRHKSRLIHVNFSSHHYGGQLKTTVDQEAGVKIDWYFLISERTKKNENKNLKMPCCVKHLTVQIVLTERKTSLITVFPQLLKIMAKKARNFRN